MPSSYGEDASADALRSAYDMASVSARLSQRHRCRLDGEIAAHLRATRAYREAPLVLGYVAMREEFDCAPILEGALADGKDVALPVFDRTTNRLAFRVVSGLDDLERDPLLASVPRMASSRPIPADLGLAGSICLVPGLVFDATGYRVGYGAGYWDEFLCGYGGTKVGLAYALQISGSPLPREEAHDVAVDLLVSDSAVWVCRR